MAISNTFTSLRVDGPTAIKGGYVPLHVLGLSDTITFTAATPAVITSINTNYNRYVKIKGRQDPNKAPTVLDIQSGFKSQMPTGGYNTPLTKTTVPTSYSNYEFDDYVIFYGAIASVGSRWIIGQVTSKSGNTWTIAHLYRVTSNTATDDPMSGTSGGTDEGLGTSENWQNFSSVSQSTIKVNGYSRRTNQLNKTIANDLSPIMGILTDF